MEGERRTKRRAEDVSSGDSGGSSSKTKRRTSQSKRKHEHKDSQAGGRGKVERTIFKQEGRGVEVVAQGYMSVETQQNMARSVAVDRRESSMAPTRRAAMAAPMVALSLNTAPWNQSLQSEVTADLKPCPCPYCVHGPATMCAPPAVPAAPLSSGGTNVTNVEHVYPVPPESQHDPMYAPCARPHSSLPPIPPPTSSHGRFVYQAEFPRTSLSLDLYGDRIALLMTSEQYVPTMAPNMYQRAAVHTAPDYFHNQHRPPSTWSPTVDSPQPYIVPAMYNAT